MGRRTNDSAVPSLQEPGGWWLPLPQGSGAWENWPTILKAPAVRWVRLLPPARKQAYFPTLQVRPRVLVWCRQYRAGFLLLLRYCPQPWPLPQTPGPLRGQTSSSALGQSLPRCSKVPAIIFATLGAKMLNSGTRLQAFSLVTRSILSSERPPYEMRPILILFHSFQTRKQRVGNLPGWHSREAAERGLAARQLGSGAHILAR